MAEEATHSRAMKRPKSERSKRILDRMAQEAESFLDPTQEEAKDELQRKPRKMSPEDAQARFNLQDLCLFMINSGPYTKEAVNKALAMTLKWLDKNPTADADAIWERRDDLADLIDDDWEPPWLSQAEIAEDVTQHIDSDAETEKFPTVETELLRKCFDAWCRERQLSVYLRPLKVKWQHKGKGKAKGKDEGKSTEPKQAETLVDREWTVLDY